MFDCTDLIKFEMRMGGTIWFVVCDYPFLMTLMYHVAILKTFLVFFQYVVFHTFPAKVGYGRSGTVIYQSNT